MNILNNVSKIVFLITLGLGGLSACGSDGGTGGEASILSLELPFVYTVGAQSLETTTGAGTVYISIGSYGAHFNPLSGDLIGDAKSNLIGFYAQDITQLVELPASGGNDDGICDGGESCAFWGGLSGELIRSRIPAYIAPVAATLTRVRLNSGPDTNYFDTPLHWEIDMALSSQFSLRIGHLATLSTQLRDKILAATGIDTDSYTGPTGNLFTRAVIPLAAGDVLAYPQVFASELPGQSGFYVGGGIVNNVPWAQMEFTIADHVVSSDVCVYDLIAPSQKSAIQSAMVADMDNPDSFRYGNLASTRWVWSAEGLLCPVYTLQPDDFSNIHTRFGGWTERPEVGTTIDELFAIVKIEKTSAIYDPLNYDSAAVDHLVSRTKPGSTAFSWTMPDSSVVNPFYPVGEVIDENIDTLLIKWRDIGWTAPVYQRASYLLDSQGLKVKWGMFASSASDAIRPDLDFNDVCNDFDTLCYDHQPRL